LEVTEVPHRLADDEVGGVIDELSEIVLDHKEVDELLTPDEPLSGEVGIETPCAALGKDLTKGI